MIEKRKVRIKKLVHFQGELPQYQSVGASGFDLCAQIKEKLVLAPGKRVVVPTGLAMEIPLGYEIQIRSRSGWAIKRGITVINSPGTIDADYRGEIQIGLANLGDEALEIMPNDRVAQAVLCPVVHAEFEEVKELSDTVRGAGGFGSTGFSEALAKK